MNNRGQSEHRHKDGNGGSGKSWRVPAHNDGKRGQGSLGEYRHKDGNGVCQGSLGEYRHKDGNGVGQGSLGEYRHKDGNGSRVSLDEYRQKDGNGVMDVLASTDTRMGMGGQGSLGDYRYKDGNGRVSGKFWRVPTQGWETGSRTSWREPTQGWECRVRDVLASTDTRMGMGGQGSLGEYRHKDENGGGSGKYWRVPTQG